MRRFNPATVDVIRPRASANHLTACRHYDERGTRFKSEHIVAAVRCSEENLAPGMTKQANDKAGAIFLRWRLLLLDR